MRADPVCWLRLCAGAAFAAHAAHLLPGVHDLFVDPPFRPPLPGLAALQLHEGATIRGLLVLMIGSGLHTALRPGRVAPALLAACGVVLLAQDATLYLNHLYLMTLLAALCAALPSPGWGAPIGDGAVALLRFQVAVPYLFGGLAKLDPDWLAGHPLEAKLPAWEPVIGPIATTAWLPLAMSWSGLALDLLAPLMLWLGWMRAPAWAAVLVFHLINSRLFQIGVFPWLMLALTPALLPADTLARLGTALRRGDRTTAWLLAWALPVGLISAVWPRDASIATALIGGFAGALLGWLLIAGDADAAPSSPAAPAPPRVLVVVWAAVQLLLPLRHLIIPGDVAWTEEGHRYAWRMLLRVKAVDEALFEVSAPDGQRWYVEGETLLRPHQLHEGFSHPDVVYAAAQHLAAVWARHGHPGVAVRARIKVALNQHPATWLVDPTVDLVTAPAPGLGAGWILASPRG